MKRFSAPGIVLPLLLAVVGVALILVGQLQLDGPPHESLPAIPDATTPVAVASASPTAEPSPTPIPDDWVAVQIEIASVDLNVAVKHATQGESAFPPDDAAYVLY